MTYCSKFGTFGNDRHLPSVETCGSRFVAGVLSVPADAVSYIAFIEFNIRDTTVGCNEKNNGGLNSHNYVSFSWLGRIAQLVEQRTENPCVAGSIPAPATTLNQP